MAELTIDQALQQGIEAHKVGQVQEADRLYTAILKVQPKHPDANHNMGVLAVGVGEVEEALPFFKVALESNPGTAQFWLSYIDALIRLDKLTDAKAVFDQAKSKGANSDDFNRLEQRLIELNNGHASVEWNALQLNLKEQKLLEALNVARGTTRKSPDGVEGMGVLGACLRANGGVAKNLEVFNKAIELNPDNAEALLYRGLIRLNQENKPLALADLELVHRLQPHIRKIGDLVVGLKVQTHDYSGAIVLLLNMIAIDPEDEQRLATLGFCYQHLGDLNAAIEAYKKTLAIMPENAEVHINLGTALKDQGKLEEAIEAYKKALAIKCDHADAYYSMGNALQEQGKLEEAIEAYKKALVIKPKHAEAYNNVGNALQGQGKLEEAIEAYNTAIAIKPDYADAYNNVGVVLQEQGKLEEAIEAFHKALDVKPDLAGAQHIIYSLTGETTTTAPKKYVETLFDEYAKKFEQSLVGNLEYKTPRLLADIILKERGSGSLGSVLDLGCGTGLTGVEIKDYCSNLEGIDLSKKMLELANEKNVYDKLTHTDILDYLSDMDLCFDYFIATDVLVYVGDLSELFRLIKSRNKRKGKLAFSTEKNLGGGFRLETSGRYSHAKSYIDSLCKKFDYSILYYAEADLRKERGTFLTGGLYLLDFE